MTTAELLARMDEVANLTIPMPAWRRTPDGNVTFGTEGQALTQRELREWMEAHAS